MFKRLLFGAGAAYLARKFMGGRSRSTGRNYSRRSRGGLGGMLGGSRRRSGFGF